jgi:hypothetical protein
VAVPALRYLGVRGDRAALRAVGTALARPELERAACLALIDAGSGGLAELDRAFWDPDLSPLVVNALAAITSFAPLEAYTFMDRLLDRTRFERGSEALRRLAAPLPALIARVDVPDHLAARTLLELATHPLLDRAAVLDAFARAPGADRLLVEATGSARDSEREALLLEAVARVAPAECFDWVARRARSPRLEGLAFAALAAYPGEEAVCTLLELRPSSRRGDEASYLAAWRKALEIDSTRAVAVARNPYIVADPPSGRRLLEVLVASQSKAAVPALIALARRGEIDEDDRERALLAAGEVGGGDDLGELARFLEGLPSSEKRLAAASIWAGHALSPERALDTLLVGSDARVLEAVRALLSGPEVARRRTTTLIQLTRALEPWLEHRPDPSRELQ